MAINDLFVELEKAVSTAKAKQDARDKAAAAYQAAQNDYVAAVNKVTDLKASVIDSIGNIFPDANPRVRQS